MRYAMMLVAAALAFGCAATETTGDAPAQKRSMVDRVAQTVEGFTELRVRLDVPLILSRDNYSSSAAALAMVMSSYAATRLDKAEVWQATGTTYRQVLKDCGLDMAGLARAAGAYGFSRHRFRTGLSPEDLRELLRQGVPPILNIHVGPADELRSARSVVVTGFDETGFDVSDPFEGTYHLRPQELVSRWRARLCSPVPGVVGRSAFVLWPR